MSKPLTRKQQRLLDYCSADWQDAPYWTRGTTIASLLRRGLIEHQSRVPMVVTYGGMLYVPWLSSGQIKLCGAGSPAA